jgi:hypothetical protein
MGLIAGLQRILQGFDQRGGVWVGMSTALTFGLVGLEAAGVCKAPAWWVSPTGVYAIVLGFFVLSKSGSYFVDSRWNSQAGAPPGKKDGTP